MSAFTKSKEEALTTAAVKLVTLPETLAELNESRAKRKQTTWRDRKPILGGKMLMPLTSENDILGEMIARDEG